jgi:hypothetical protein
MTEPLTDEQLQRGLLVHLELKESIDRMKDEGFNFLEIVSGIASLTNDLIAKEHDQVVAASWFLGMARNAAALIKPQAH